MVVIEVEVKDGRIGRIRVSRTENASGECLLRFVQESVEKGSTVNTDGWQGYNKLSESVYTHKVTIAKPRKKIGIAPPCAFNNLSVNLLNRWLLETHQGAVRKKHFDYYLDEFTFRFNR